MGACRVPGLRWVRLAACFYSTCLVYNTYYVNGVELSCVALLCFALAQSCGCCLALEWRGLRGNGGETDVRCDTMHCDGEQHVMAWLVGIFRMGDPITRMDFVYLLVVLYISCLYAALCIVLILVEYHRARPKQTYLL